MIELGRHVEVVNGRLLSGAGGIEADEGVNLEVCEVEVNVDGVKANEEVDEGFLLGLRYVLEESIGNLGAGREGCADVDAESQRLGVDVTNVNTTFMGEENSVTLALRVDADIVLGVGRVGKEGLENEVVQSSGNGLNLEMKRLDLRS